MKKRYNYNIFNKYKDVVSSPEVRRGKIALLKTTNTGVVFKADAYAPNIMDAAIDSWKGKIKWEDTPNVVVSVSGLSMNQQYGLAKKLKSGLKPEQRKKILIDDGPYETSALTIEKYIQE